jgi:hypothetical protein
VSKKAATDFSALDKAVDEMIRITEKTWDEMGLSQEERWKRVAAFSLAVGELTIDK